MKKDKLEDKIKKVTKDKETPLSELASKINALILLNLDEALRSDSEFVRKKAEKLKGKKRS